MRSTRDSNDGFAAPVCPSLAVSALSPVRLTRRRLVRGALAGVAGAALAGCGASAGGSGTSATGPSTRATGAASLTWLIRSDMGPLMSDWHEKSAETFRAAHPNVTVEVNGVPHAEYNTKATAMAVGGTPPDIVGNYAAGFGTFVVNNALVDVLPYAKREKYDLDTFEPAALNAIRREGKLYGLPLGHNPWLFFYNRTLFEQRGAPLPPTSWKDRRWSMDTMIAAGQQLTSRPGEPSAASWGVVLPEGQLGTQAIWQWGADPFNKRGGPERSTAYQTAKIEAVHYLEPKAVEAIQWVVGDLAHKYKVAPTPAEQKELGAGFKTPLHSGRLGLWAVGTWAVQNFKAAEVPFKWGLAPLPYGPGAGGASVPSLFNDSFQQMKGGRAPEAAFLLLAHLATGDRARAYAEATGYFPANRSLYDLWYESTLRTSGFSQTKKELRAVMEGAVAQGYPPPGKTLNRLTDYSRVWGKAIDPVRQGQEQASSALREAQQQFEALSREGA